MTTHIIVPTLDFQRGLAGVERVMANSGTDAVTHVIEDAEGTGYTRTVNRGLRQLMPFEASDNVLLLNDDCALSDGWLLNLSMALAIYAPLGVGFVGPSGPCRTPPQNSGRPGDRRRPRLVHHLSGFCLLIAGRAVQLLDERFVHYASDIALQLDSAFKSLWVPSVYCDHELHAPHEEWWRCDQALFYEIYRGKWR